MRYKLFILTLLLSTGLASCEKKNCEKGIRKKDCICTAQFDPVCGCDNVTYSNACEAECHGITSFTEGECK